MKSVNLLENRLLLNFVILLKTHQEQEKWTKPRKFEGKSQKITIYSNTTATSFIFQRTV